MLRLAMICALASAAAAQTRMVQVDAAQVIGTIRSLQGFNAGPVPLSPTLPEVSRQYKDLRIDLIRTHDFFGPTDIDARWPKPDPIARAVHADGAKSVFPDWSADPEKEESYNFGPSDKVIQAIVGTGAEVYYRIGRSWSADPSPPADFDKFANIVLHVAMHYNAGWNHGFHDRIRYWEFWNEPDLEASWFPGFAQPFWTGTPQQFYSLYEKVARALKQFDPSMKVGGPGKAAGNLPGAIAKVSSITAPPIRFRSISTPGITTPGRTRPPMNSAAWPERFAHCSTPKDFPRPKSTSASGI